MIKFLDWLKKKQQPTQIVSKSAMAPQTKPKDEEEEDLDDYWQASADSAGLSDKRRKQLISNNPRFSDGRLKEIEDAWKSKD
jgi:uncharacterized tellurite resistance protein B-like protein